MSIEKFKKEELEKFVLFTTIGLLEAIYSKSMTIYEAENYLFSPKNMRLLKSKGISINIIDIIHECTELENIERLLPDKLDVTLVRLKESAMEELSKRKNINMTNIFDVE